MNTTRASLLIRVKNRADGCAWEEFHQLYAPLLYRYARARGLDRQDAEEIRDECLLIIARKMGAFEYDKRKGGFKNWLYTIASGKVIDLLRSGRMPVADSHDMDGLSDPAAAPDEAWERQWKDRHLRYCVEQVRGSVSEANYRAFHLLVLEGCSVEEVCTSLDMNANRVYKAKSRVLRVVQRKLAEIAPDLLPNEHPALRP